MPDDSGMIVRVCNGDLRPLAMEVRGSSGTPYRSEDVYNRSSPVDERFRTRKTLIGGLYAVKEGESSYAKALANRVRELSNCLTQ